MRLGNKIFSLQASDTPASSTMSRRILGILLLLVGVLGVGISAAGGGPASSEEERDVDEDGVPDVGEGQRDEHYPLRVLKTEVCDQN